MKSVVVPFYTSPSSTGDPEGSALIIVEHVSVIRDPSNSSKFIVDMTNGQKVVTDAEGNIAIREAMGL